MIETARLALRPPQRDDLTFIQDEMNTPAVMTYLGGRLVDASLAEQALEEDIAAFAGGGYRRWTIWRREDHRRIGRCGLFTVRSEAAPEAIRGQVEIGWTLAQPYWGHGYASEAASGVLDLAFGEVGTGVVWAETSDSNQPSTRLMHRLGFERTPQYDFHDPEYPARDNPTTIWRMKAARWRARG